MANSDKNIIITPNTGNTADPSIVFSGANTSVSAQDITLKVYPYDQGTLSFEGVNGQILAIDNANTGTSFSVNDMSGLPSIDVSDLGVIRLMPYPTDVIATTFAANTVIAAGTTTTPAIKMGFSAQLTAPLAGVFEYGNAHMHFTNNTTAGRAHIPALNYYRLGSNLSPIGPAISDFFGATSSLPFDAGGMYEIEFELIYAKTTSGTVTWTILNTATTIMDVVMTTTPIGGFTAVPTASALAIGAMISQVNASTPFTATASITGGTTHMTRLKIYISAASSANIRLRVTSSAGTITPLRGSYWKAMRISSTNVGTYAT